MIQHERTDQPAHGAGPSEVRLRILVVDDHLDTARAFQKLLERTGYAARAAGSYREALAIAGEWVPDILFSDLTMPGKSGTELIQCMRRAYPQLQAIAMSGYVDAEHVTQTREAGYAEFLAKPVSMDRLVAAIERLARAAA